MQADGLAVLVVAGLGSELVVGGPVLGKVHGSVCDEGRGGFCGNDVRKEYAFAVRVRGIYRGKGGAGLEQGAEGAADGGIGRGEEAGAEFAAGL